MISKPVAGLALECALAERQRFDTLWGQIRDTDAQGRPVRREQLAAIARLIPEPLLRKFVSVIQHDTLPFGPNTSLEGPIAYGGEAVVYRLSRDDGERQVLKLYYSLDDPTLQIFQPAERAARKLFKARTTHAMYLDCFGDMVLPASYFLYTSRYGRANTPMLGCIQGEIEGPCFFIDPTSALLSETDRLRQGATKMINVHNHYPDFAGRANTKITDTGRIYFADTGHIFKPEEAPTIGELVTNLALLDIHIGQAVTANITAA